MSQLELLITIILRNRSGRELHVANLPPVETFEWRFAALEQSICRTKLRMISLFCLSSRSFYLMA